MNTIKTCRECHQVLSDTEIEYYETRCEQCERDWSDEITAWRHGAKNEKFDELYSAPNPVLN